MAEQVHQEMAQFRGERYVALNSEIREKIDNWLSFEAGRSVSELARRAKVPYSSLRRILQDETTPNYPVLASVLAVAACGSEIQSLLSKQYPELSHVFSIFREKEVAAGTLISSLDQDSIYVLAFLTCDKPVSLTQLREEFGTRGLRSLELLKMRNVVEMSEDGETINVLMPELSFHHPDDILKLIQSHLNFTNTANMTSNKATMGVAWGAMSLEGYIKSLKVLETAAVTISKIRSSCPGEIPMHFTYLLNSYNDLHSVRKTGAQDEI
jgi:Ni,Fe-hydrogenase I small subunit